MVMEQVTVMVMVHVAGTVGGSTYGVAKNVSLVPIRILGCDGSGASSNVIAGLD